MAPQKKTHPIKTRISLKLYCSSVLSTLIFTIRSFSGSLLIKNFGEFADTANTRQIRQIANQFLASMAREKARKYDEIFLHTQTSVTFLGMKAGDIYTDLNTGDSPIPRFPHEPQS